MWWKKWWQKPFKILISDFPNETFYTTLCLVHPGSLCRGTAHISIQRRTSERGDRSGLYSCQHHYLPGKSDHGWNPDRGKRESDRCRDRTDGANQCCRL